MEKCRIKALSDSYSANLPLSSKGSSIGSILKIRPTIGAVSPTINVTWKVNYCNYNYMMMFYLLFKDKVFELDVIIFNDVETKTCKFVPDTFIAVLDQNVWTITSTLEIIL